MTNRNHLFFFFFKTENCRTSCWSWRSYQSRRRTWSSSQAIRDWTHCKGPWTFISSSKSKELGRIIGDHWRAIKGNDPKVSNKKKWETIISYLYIYIYIPISYNEADLKLEDADRKITSLEKELGEQEEKYEELLAKHNESKAELDELARQFDEL